MTGDALAALCFDGAESVFRVPEKMTPSQWSERHIHLSRVETVLPGPWRNDVFPFLGPLADELLEALEAGKHVTIIKAGQVGVSRVVLNWINYLKSRYPGSILYMTATHEVAKEFSRDRLDRDLDTCGPLRAKALRGRKAGELVAIKRFVDGKIVLVGGKAVSSYESVPYPFVAVDEYDSLQDELTGRGDPLANIEIRMDAAASMGARTMTLAFAHPTTSDRGVGKLYYGSSDQRRAFVRCVHCGSHDHWLDWKHVQVLPADDEMPEVAERIPDRYTYIAPCCGAVVSDSERAAMARTVEFRSTLPPEEAESKRWVGLHISQLYSGKSLRFLAEKWVEGLDDASKRRVFVNKRLGDTYKEVAREADPDAWRRCIGPYDLGVVPDEVQFLTAGQDSRSAELHWAVWGWGMVRDAGGHPRLCGWLIDCGVERRQPARPILEPSDLSVFDQLIYDRTWSREDGGEAWVSRGLHDAGWQPIAAYMYSLQRRDGRAFPAKGAGLDESSAARTQPIAMQTRPGFKDPYSGEVHRSANDQHAILNTYLLKSEIVGMVDTQFPTQSGGTQGRVTLPRDVPGRFLAESGSEFLTWDNRGRQVWRHKGPNHFSDCNVMALGAAIYLARDLKETAEECREVAHSERAARVQSEQHREHVEKVAGKPDWWTGARGGRW